MLPQRTIPFPTSISPEARAALERLVSEDGTPINAAYAMPAPEAHDAWMSIKAAVDAQYAAAVKGLAGTLRSSVETIQIDCATVHVATPEAPFRTDCAYIDLHGGALVFGGGDACRAGAQMQADQHAVRCYGIDYRMPPEHPVPRRPGRLPGGISLRPGSVMRRRTSSSAGRSAGGNLAVALMLRARDEGLPLPAGLVLLSPQVDLTESGDSFELKQDGGCGAPPVR